MSLAALLGCDSSPRQPERTANASESAPGTITYRSSVQPITKLADARPGVFIPPFEACRAPVEGDSATSADGQVCTHVMISGCTEEGKYFPDYADCEIVRRQRPYWPAPPAGTPRADDPRFSDPAYVKESAWASEQIAASGCTCCHDGRVAAASQWDIALGPLWIDSLSDTGLSLFAGLADSSVLGAYPPAENHGFDRESVGVPTTDPERMRAFAMGELARRGLSEEWGRAVPPFGGPIYANSVKKPEACAAGQGVDGEGRVHWTGGPARYVYLLEEGSKNPGVPPNLDLPEGTRWRLDVLASAAPLATGIRFGETPEGSFQTSPAKEPVAPLRRGARYQLVALLDVGVTHVNCIFEFGKAVAPAAPGGGSTSLPPADGGYPGALPDASTPQTQTSADAGGAQACTLRGGDAQGFGAACSDTTQHSDCSCAANYCSKSPFDPQGYCSVTGCKQDPSVCPAGWTCFDVSMFAPGQPAVCMRP